MLRRLVFVLMALMTTTVAWAQQNAPRQTPEAAYAHQQRASRNSDTEILPAGHPAYRVATPVCATDDEVCSARNDLEISNYRKMIRLNEITVKQFQDQRDFTWVVMLVVMLMVCLGLLFSGAQLWVVLKTGRRLETGDVNAEIAGKIVIRSSAMGISVLAISAVFFYLALNIVYTIH